MSENTGTKKTNNMNRAIYIIALLVLASVILVTIFLNQNKRAQASNHQGIISGKVTEENGTGVENILVEIYDGNETRVAGRKTGNAGQYEFDLQLLPTDNYKLKFTYGEKDSLKYNGLVYSLKEVIGDKRIYNRQQPDKGIENVNIAFILPHNFQSDSEIQSFYNNIKSEIKSIVESNINIKLDKDILITYNAGNMYINGDNGNKKNNEPISFASSEFGGLNGFEYRNIIVVVANNDLNAWGDLNLEESLNLVDGFNKVLPIIIGNNIETQFNGLQKYDYTDIRIKILDLIGVKEGVVSENFYGTEGEGTGVRATIPQQDINDLVKWNSLSDSRKQELGDKYYRSVTTKLIDVSDKATVNVILKEGSPLQAIDDPGEEDDSGEDDDPGEEDDSGEDDVPDQDNDPDTDDYTNPDLNPLNINTGATLSGFVFRDDNGNGIRDAEEELITDEIEVWLYDNSDIVVQKGKTENGEYVFGELTEEARYRIEFTYGTFINNGDNPLELVNGQNYETTTWLSTNSGQGSNSCKNNAKDIGREDFNDNFKSINNNKTKILNGDKGKTALVNETKITAATGWITIPDFEVNTNYDPDNPDTEEPQFIPVPVYANLGLIKRPGVKISVKTEVSALIYRLANGQVFIEEKNEEGYLLFNKNRTPLKEAYRIETDQYLIHGSTVEIEYMITIKNETEINNAYFNEDDYEVEIDKIINYLDLQNNAMLYREYKGLITEPGDDNTKYKWELLKLENNTLKNADESTILDYKYMQQMPHLRKGYQYLFSNYLDTTKIPVGEEVSLKLSVSKVITSAGGGDELNYRNVAEIIEYSNKAGRRITNILDMPGSYNGMDDDGMNPNIEDAAIRVSVTQPLGENNSWWYNMWEYFKNIFLYPCFSY